MATPSTPATLQPISAVVSGQDNDAAAATNVPASPPVSGVEPAPLSPAANISEITSRDVDSTGLMYVQYSVDKEEQYLPSIQALIGKDLSEPYSIYVYRYFLNTWPELCFLGLDPSPPHDLHAVIISKLETYPPPHHHNHYTATGAPPDQPRHETSRGYVAMLAVATAQRRRGVATRLVALTVDLLRDMGADEVVLETEASNAASLKLYERLGFIRTKRLHRYYLNGGTAFRLAIYLRAGAATRLAGGDGSAGAAAVAEHGEG